MHFAEQLDGVDTVTKQQRRRAVGGAVRQQIKVALNRRALGDGAHVMADGRAPHIAKGVRERERVVDERVDERRPAQRIQLHHVERVTAAQKRRQTPVLGADAVDHERPLLHRVHLRTAARRHQLQMKHELIVAHLVRLAIGVVGDELVVLFARHVAPIQHHELGQTALHNRLDRLQRLGRAQRHFRLWHDAQTLDAWSAPIPRNCDGVPNMS